MQKLSVNIQSLFCAARQVNNYVRAVEELVYNALDADSTSIAIRVHMEEQTIQVIDNGYGISNVDFKILGQKYATSKCVDLNTLKSAPHKYGFRGQALANIIEVSQCVKITSRCQDSEGTWVKKFKTKEEDRIYKSSRRPSKGTTVEIKGFLYNLKIQKKSIEPLSELNNIKIFLEQLSLIHTKVSFSLRDDSKNEIIFQLHKNRDIYQALSCMFGIEKKDLQELKVEKNEYKVKAYIGKKDKDINSKHWIYLNGRLLQNCKVHRIVNDNLSKALKLNTRGKTRDKSKKPYDQEGENISNSKIPTYFIFLECPYYDYDLSSATKPFVEFKNWEQITKLMEKLIQFYTGSISIKEPNPNMNQDVEKKTDGKRDQVKKIMQRILGSNAKKIGVSQMHKGVKGKLIKRKPKKKSQKLSLLKIKANKNNDNTRAHKDKPKENDEPNCDTTELNTKIQNRHQIEIEEPEVTMKEKLKNTTETRDKFKNKTHLRSNFMAPSSHNIHKQKDSNNKPSKKRTNCKITPRKHKLDKIRTKNLNSKKINLKPKVDPLLKRFEEDPSGSIKKRCDALAEKVEDLMSYKKKRKRKIFIQETVHYSNFIKNNKNYSVRKKVDEIVIHDYIPQPPKFNLDDFDDRVWNKDNAIPAKSSYDLIKTVLRTQETVSNSGIADICYKKPLSQNSTSFQIAEMPEDFERYSTKPKRTDNYVIHNDAVPADYSPVELSYQQDYNTRQSTVPTPDPLSFIPVATFESHDYNLEYINRISHEYNFYNDSINGSCKNLKSRQFISTKSRDDFDISNKKRKLIRTEFKKPFLNTKNKLRSEKIHSIRTYKDYNTNLQQESSYTIEFSKSNRTYSLDTTQPRFHPDIRPETDPHHTKHVGATFTVEKDVDCASEIGSTYTILQNDSPVLEDMQDLYAKDTIDETRADESFIEETNQHYNLININDNNLYNSSAGRSKDQGAEKIENIIFVSKSQEQDLIIAETLMEDLNPLDICETVHNNENDFENNDSKRNDSRFSEEFEIDSLICDRNIYTQRISHEVEQALEREYVSKQKNKEKSPHDAQVSNFNFKNRLRFMPKGMSQIFEKCQSKNACDYDLQKEYYEENIYDKFAEHIQTNVEIFEPKVQHLKELTTKAIEKVNNRINKDNASLIFDGESLKQAKVFKQIDNKFIAATMYGKINQLAEKSEYLVLFDQHAVHERIRLEFNLSSYFDGNQWKSKTLDEAIALKLTTDEILYLHNYKDKFETLGLEWIILETGEVNVKAIPEAIFGKNPRQADVIMKALKNLISEEINAIKSQSGCISLYPKAIMDLVASEACRYAIMFGDKLSVNNCVDLLLSLADCKIPFQCAHGRPVMAVLMDVKRRTREYKLNLFEVKKWAKWNKNRN